MVQRDEGKSAESPKDKGVREAREWPLADNFGLAEDFRYEVPDAAADRCKAEACTFF